MSDTIRTGLDAGEVTYVKRIEVGGIAAGQAEDAMLLVNKCLEARGRIIEIEKLVSVETLGETQVVRQALAYHIGFRRKPHWLEG